MNDLEFYSTSDAKYDKDAKTTSNCTINETVDNDCEPALDNGMFGKLGIHFIGYSYSNYAL